MILSQNLEKAPKSPTPKRDASSASQQFRVAIMSTSCVLWDPDVLALATSTKAMSQDSVGFFF
jgi:hypothetical protein